jgi:hypothetical protein
MKINIQLSGNTIRRNYAVSEYKTGCSNLPNKPTPGPQLLQPAGKSLTTSTTEQSCIPICGGGGGRLVRTVCCGEAGKYGGSVTAEKTDMLIFKNHRAFLTVLKYQARFRVDIMKVLNRRLDKLMKKKRISDQRENLEDEKSNEG